MDILTGSSGFIGSYIKKYLPDIECIPHDLIASSQIDSCNNFYFLSSFGNLTWQTDENKIIQANILDLVHILKNIKWDEIHSFVYVSSSSVGLEKQTTYSRTKKAAEEILLSYKEKYNAPICIIRPLSVTGVGDHREHLIPTLIRAAKKGLTIPFVSDPSHDWVDVSDVAKGIILLATEQAKGIFELGTGISTTNKEVKAIVERLVGTINTEEMPTLRSYDALEWVSKNFRAQGYGWKPKKSLEQIITEMI